MRTTKALLTLSALVLAAVCFAQSPRGKAEATISGKKISIDYGRPALKGRDMLGRAPAGTVWRMGADQATTLTTEGNLVFDGTTVPAGSYSLFAKRVSADDWELVFNKQTGQWGTEHDAAQDLASVPFEWEKQDTSTEQFTIELSGTNGGGTFKMMWGENVLSTDFQVK